jgi:phosphoglycerol transferase MdoB-like AlkP superfamily enzyme
MNLAGKGAARNAPELRPCPAGLQLGFRPMLIIEAALASPVLFTSPRVGSDARRAGASLRLLLGCLLWPAAAALALWFTGRSALFIWQHGRLNDLSLPVQAMAFVHGLRMDAILLGFLALPLVLLLCLWPRPWARLGAVLCAVWVGGLALLLVFMEIASFPFFAEYDVRPNLLMVQYLDYPLDVAAMLWQDQRRNLFLSAAALGLVGWWFWRRSGFIDRAENVLRAPWHWRALALLPLLLLLALMIRSSLGHRPANISDALYSPNRVANEIAKNSLYSAAYDTYRARKDGARKAPTYGALPIEEAYARVHAMLGLGAVTDPQWPLQRVIAPLQPRERPRNLVILLQESMGGQFVGYLGHKDGVTPNVDALAAESLAFMRLHSNGTRSIQGLQGMSAGFLANIGEGVLKRPKAQRDFFTLASLLKPLGYHASFIYGGEARFDDMKVWYLGNGFDEVIEQKDYRNPGFVSTWGVSDEDLMRKAHERFLAHHAAGKPFVSVVFSSSNHTPFELPEGKITWEPGVEKFSVRNAIKYADYAIGVFMQLAKASPYYRDTVFVVVADHNVRVYGDDAVPVPGFHIPGVIHVPGEPARQFKGLASQPDVLATALSYLGVPLQVPVMGTPIDLPGRSDWVLMQFTDTYGLLRGDEVAVMRPGQGVYTARYADGRLHPAAANEALQRDGLALLHVTEDLYERRLYRQKPAAAQVAQAVKPAAAAKP